MQPAAYRYTPELAEEAVRRAGFKGVQRLLHLVWTLVVFVFGFWRDSRCEGQERTRRQRKRAVWLRERFVSLGATFVKIGQVLSTRPDLVPLPYIEEMATLQDQVPPFDSEIAHALIASELGRPIAETFAVFNPEPIAAASIGQVYKAKLKDGTDVVVKVQRPGLIPVVSLDLGIMRRIAVFIDRHPRLSRGMPYTAILDEFGLSMFDQADYTVEGRYADRFREHFKDFPGIETPRIHWDLTTARVMTMDFVHGMKVTDLVALEDAGIAFRDVVSLGVRATIKQLLEDGFFHADVHPGNLFVDYEGALVYIDFGMVGELTPYVQEKIVDVFLHSVHRHYEALVDDFIDLGFLSPQIDRAALVPVAERIFTAQYGEGDRRLSVKEIFAEVSKVLYEYPFRIPEKIAFILRTIITLEGIIHKLIPDYKFLETAAPYAAKILLTDAKASIREKLVDELFEGGHFKPDRLARLFGTATKEPTFRFGEVAPAVLRYLTSPEGHRVREGLLNAAGQGSLASTDFSWRVYVEKAAQDPTWSLDDLLLPVCQFLETEDGVLFLIKLMDRREVLLGANGNAMASIGLAV
ncbi:MAG: ABC1 kinase family protein, partial [Candidatus Sericytochromatia bacterium]